MAAPAVQASPLASFQGHAQRCFEESHHQVCEQALLEAEALQRRASARSAYPCQTLLLGVQADLVMQQLQAGRGAQAIADLQAATRDCAGLLPISLWTNNHRRCVSPSDRRNHLGFSVPLVEEELVENAVIQRLG